MGQHFFQLGGWHMTQVFRPSFWYQKLVPKLRTPDTRNWYQKCGVSNFVGSGDQWNTVLLRPSFWYQNAWHTSKVTGTSFWCQKLGRRTWVMCRGPYLWCCLFVKLKSSLHCSVPGWKTSVLMVGCAVTDGGVVSMKSMPPMHNGVFQGDNFPPPVARYISSTFQITKKTRQHLVTLSRWQHYWKTSGRLAVVHRVLEKYGHYIETESIDGCTVVVVVVSIDVLSLAPY